MQGLQQQKQFLGRKPPSVHEGLWIEILVCAISHTRLLLLLLLLPSCSIQGLTYTHVVLFLYLYLFSFFFSRCTVCVCVCVCVCEHYIALHRNLGHTDPRVQTTQSVLNLEQKISLKNTAEESQIQTVRSKLRQTNSRTSVSFGLSVTLMLIKFFFSSILFCYTASYKTGVHSTL